VRITGENKSKKWNKEEINRLREPPPKSPLAGYEEGNLRSDRNKEILKNSGKKTSRGGKTRLSENDESCEGDTPVKGKCKRRGIREGSTRIGLS